MPTTDKNPPSRFERFLCSPLRWSKVDIESQQSQQSVIHSFQDPSPQMHQSPSHIRDQHSSQHDSIANGDSPSSYAVEDYNIQGPTTQSFAHNSRRTLFNTPIRRPRSTSNPELQFSIPGSFTQEEDYSKSQSGNQNIDFNDFIHQRRHEDREIDLEGQYSSLRTPRNHLEYDSNSSFADRYHRASDTHDQNFIPDFEHRINESQSPYPNAQDPHRDSKSESTSASTQRPGCRSHPGNEYPPAEALFNPLDYTNDDIESQRFRAPKSPAIPIDLHFSGVIQTLRRPMDYFGGNKEEMKEMWQCVPNEDLEEGMLGCYAWNHEDKDVCVSCRRVRTREARSKLVALKRALGFRG